MQTAVLAAKPDRQPVNGKKRSSQARKKAWLNNKLQKALADLLAGGQAFKPTEPPPGQLWSRSQYWSNLNWNRSLEKLVTAATAGTAEQEPSVEEEEEGGMEEEAEPTAHAAATKVASAKESIVQAAATTSAPTDLQVPVPASVPAVTKPHRQIPATTTRPLAAKAPATKVASTKVATSKVTSTQIIQPWR